jgi:hypothetical protein
VPAIAAPSDLLSVDLPVTDLLKRSDAADERYEIRLADRVRDCMTDRGFEYPPIDYRRRPWWFNYEHPFGPWSAQEAEYGYLLPVGDYRPPNHATEALTDVMSESEREAWHVAFRGDTSSPSEPLVATLADQTDAQMGFTTLSRDGCHFIAQSDVLGVDYAEYEAYRQAIENWANQLRDAATVAKEVDSAVAAWTECMSDAGYGDIAAPSDLALRFADRPQGSAPSQEERRTIAADMACKERVELMETWFATRLQLESAFAAENELVLAEFSRMRLQAFGEP